PASRGAGPAAAGGWVWGKRRISVGGTCCPCRSCSIRMVAMPAVVVALSLQCWAQLCAASGGTEMTPDVPTGAMHAVSDRAASTNESSLYALGPRMAAHYTRGSVCEHMALRAGDVSLLCALDECAVSHARVRRAALCPDPSRLSSWSVGLALLPTGEHPRCGRKPTRRVFEWGRRWRRSGRVADHGDRSRPRSRRRSLPWCNGVTGRSRRFVGRGTSARRRSAAGLNRRPSTRERARV